jgi:hypothetical protein
LLAREEAQRPLQLLAVEAALDVGELAVEAPGLGVKEALAAFADAPGKGMGLGAAGVFHAPVRPGALHRVAQHDDQLHGRVVGGDAREAAAPVEVDRGGLAARPARRVREVGVVGGVVRLGPVLRLVVEEVHLLRIAQRHLRVVGQVRVQRGGAALLHAGDQEVDERGLGHGL